MHPYYPIQAHASWGGVGYLKHLQRHQSSLKERKPYQVRPLETKRRCTLRTVKRLGRIRDHLAKNRGSLPEFPRCEAFSCEKSLEAGNRLA